MAKSKFEYVKSFEHHETCLPNCWIVVRVDGKGYHEFGKKHNFQKPNDHRSLALMTCAAKAVMKSFTDIILAYGQSDEYSFVFRRETNLFNRRQFKFVSCICSSFTSNYVFNWSKYFGSDRLLYPPCFDGRVVLYPTDQNLKDYLSWRQTDVHINNLFNTCFWLLVQKNNLTNEEANKRLKGTTSSDKNELLFQEFGINYNNEPEEFRKGTTLIRKRKGSIVEYYGDIIGSSFWKSHTDLFASSVEKKKKSSEKNKGKSQKTKQG